MERGTEAQRCVWEGAIPLQIHLHDSEVTTLPPPPPALPNKLNHSSVVLLPPGVDTIWFEYKGVPLKWYIPTGVLFDLLCAEPERPCNLTVHFRGYPGNILTPCEGEDSVKWSYINSLKEAAYIIHGNCKNVMNMSQSDQVELWHSMLNGDFEAYIRISSKLKLGILVDEFSAKLNLSSSKSRQKSMETDAPVALRAGRIPVRMYIWNVDEDFHDLEDVPSFDSWDKILYINRPVEINEEGKPFTLHEAIKSLLPEYFGDNSLTMDKVCKAEGEEEQKLESEEAKSTAAIAETSDERAEISSQSDGAETKLLRIQGIQPKLEIPFAWVVNSLMNPEHFLHICAYIRVPDPLAT